MKKLLFIFVFAVIAESIAQSGSVYSRFGLGDLQSSFNARRVGFGGLGLAIADKNYLNPLNPAGLSSIQLTRFEVSLLYSGSKINDSNNSAFHSKTSFNGMMIGFPLKEDLGLSVALGIVPYSKVQYEVVKSSTDPLVNNYNLKITGEGGISKFFIGSSYKLPFDFSLGATYDYYFGRIETSLIADFPDSASIADASFFKDMNYHGIGFSAGLISNDLAKLFSISELSEFRIGLTFAPSVTLSADSVNNSLTHFGNIVTGTGSIKANLPYRIGIGTTFKVSNDYTFTLDYLYQPMSEFNSNGIKESNFQNYYKAALGFEYRKENIRSSDYWDFPIYRAGISYEQTPLKINGSSINQFSIYAGMSLPLTSDITLFFNSIDFAFQYSRRGTTDKNLLLENIFKLNVSFSIGEFWFVPTDR